MQKVQSLQHKIRYRPFSEQPKELHPSSKDGNSVSEHPEARHKLSQAVLEQQAQALLAGRIEQQEAVPSQSPKGDLLLNSSKSTAAFKLFPLDLVPVSQKYQKMLSSHELEAPFSPPLQEYDQDYTPTMPSTATFVKDSTLFPSPANGLLTPAPSPIKRKQPKSTQPKHDVKNAILPPTLGRTASAPDVNAVSASKATMKKQERQTSIPTFMKAGKPSTGRPRGRPRKNPIKNAPVAPAQETATLIVKPRAVEVSFRSRCPLPC